MNEYIVKFYSNDTLVGEFHIPTKEISEATHIAIDMVEGRLFWDRIKVTSI